MTDKSKDSVEVFLDCVKKDGAAKDIPVGGGDRQKQDSVGVFNCLFCFVFISIDIAIILLLC